MRTELRRIADALEDLRDMYRLSLANEDIYVPPKGERPEGKDAETEIDYFDPEEELQRTIRRQLGQPEEDEDV